MKREDFLKLEKEGKKSKAGFMSFDEFQNMEQVQKWTTSKVSVVYISIYLAGI